MSLKETRPKELCVSVVNTSPDSIEMTDVSEGIISKNFYSASMKTVEKFMLRIRFSTFKEQYPEIYKENPEFLRDIYDQLNIQLKAQIESDIKTMCDEQLLFTKLTKLEHLIKEAGDDENSIPWRPSGDPNVDIRDHRYKLKLRHKAHLELILKNHHSDIEKLQEKLISNHEEILKLKEMIINIDEQNKLKLEALAKSTFQMSKVLPPFIEENN